MNTIKLKGEEHVLVKKDEYERLVTMRSAIKTVSGVLGRVLTADSEGTSSKTEETLDKKRAAQKESFLRYCKRKHGEGLCTAEGCANVFTKMNEKHAYCSRACAGPYRAAKAWKTRRKNGTDLWGGRKSD